MSKAKQVTDENDLWPNEEYIVEQYESGADRPKSFKTPEELIADLHEHK